MQARLAMLCAAPIGGALVYAGVVPVSWLLPVGGTYSAVVPVEPKKAANAIADLTIPELTDYPGWRPRPVLHRARTDTGYRWTLYYGPSRMMVFDARLSPTAGGAGTRIVGRTSRGADFAEDKVPKGLRENGMAETLFAASLEMELNDVMPEPERLTFAQAEERRFAAVVQAAVFKTMSDPDLVFEGACVSKKEVDTPRCKAAAAERKKDDERRAQRIRDSREEQLASRYGGTYRPQGRVSFEPGKPMVDVSR